MMQWWDERSRPPMESLDWFATKSQGAALLAHFWQQVSIFSFIIMIITC